MGASGQQRQPRGFDGSGVGAGGWPAVAAEVAPEPVKLSVAAGLVQPKQRRGKGIVSILDEGEGEGLHGGGGERRGGVGGSGC